ncbi:Glycogen synthase [bioreactor metagenome]|uniref:Glycogen synthase n=1 Tax=bioreactor metagenome TaxID=1076179 RepID=A0A644WMZ6_9ZZZZ|nr:glycosyltransferase family 4 protein [Paludibacter sp.]
MKPKVLITSPSLDTNKNVGGISNLTRLLIEKNVQIEYNHFLVGKHDAQKRNTKWFFSNVSLLFKYIKQMRSRDMKITHVNYPLSELSIIINFILTLLSRLYRKRILLHLRGGALSLNEDVNLFQKILIKNSLRIADKIIVLGRKELDFLNSFYNIKLDKIVVLPNSVYVPSNNYVAKSLSLMTDDVFTFNILYIGRIDKKKGLKELLETFNFIKDNNCFKFYLAGTGEEKDWFIGECTRILGDKFEYLGVLNYAQKQVIFKEMSIFVLPSYFEGLPNALLETMAYGIVPIVTPVGSIPEVVHDDINGFIIPKNDSLSLVKKLLLLFENKTALIRLSKEAHKTISSDYSIDEYIKKLNTLYSSLLEEQSK